MDMLVGSEIPGEVPDVLEKLAVGDYTICGGESLATLTVAAHPPERVPIMNPLLASRERAGLSWLASCAGSAACSCRALATPVG
jgi:hypothetical protein